MFFNTTDVRISCSLHRYRVSQSLCHIKYIHIKLISKISYSNVIKELSKPMPRFLGCCRQNCMHSFGKHNRYIRTYLLFKLFDSLDNNEIGTSRKEKIYRWWYVVNPSHLFTFKSLCL